MGKYKPHTKFTVNYETPPPPTAPLRKRPRSQKFITLDMRSIANRGFMDDVEGDGKGGWTDQGPSNSLSGFPTGKQKMAGALFDIIDPKTNGGKSSLVLFSTHSTNCPESATIERVSSSARSIYFLHATAWGKGRKVIAEYRILYTDGTEERIPITDSKEVANWWSPKDTNWMRVGWRGSNPSTNNIGVCVYA